MRLRLLCAVLLANLMAVLAHAGTVTGSIQRPNGQPLANGIVTFSLSQSGVTQSGAITVTSDNVYCGTSSTGTVVGVTDPAASAVLSANYGAGTLPATQYFVKFTYTAASGESAPSPETTFLMTGSGTLNGNAPLLQPGNATGYKVYIGTTSGGETLQQAVVGFAGWSQSVDLVVGAVAPVSNSTLCNTLIFNDAITPSYTTYLVNLLDSKGKQVAGYPQRYYFSGATLDLSNLAPAGNLYARFPNPIVAQPGGNGLQSIAGPLSLGTNSFFAGDAKLASVDNILFVDGVKYPNIGAALAACPSLGCDIYVPSGTYVEPGYTVGNLAGTQAVTVHLGANTVSQVTSRITLESSGSIIGQSRQGSAIRADATFPTSTALVRIGSSAAVDGSRLEHLQLDCLNITGCTGVSSSFAQEESGLRDVLVHNVTGGGIGIDWETNGANNSFMEDVEVLGASNNNAATIGIKINDVKGFRGINGATVNFTGSGTLPTQCIRLDNATTGVFNSVHLEGCTNGIEVGQSTGVQGVVISQIFPSNTITDLIKIDGPDTPKNNLVIMGVLKGSATNAIHDLENSATITDTNVPFYMAGSGQTAYFNGSLQVNSISVTRTIATGTATVDLASVASGACTADSADVTLTGASVGDPVRVTAATALPAGVWLIGRVTATNTGRFQLCNLSGGAVDRASDTYTISVVK